MSWQKFHRWFWLIPVLLALAVNLNVLWNGFVWDDNYFIFRGSQSPLGDALPQHSTYHRPVVEWFWRMDYQLWDQSPFGFHLTNLILHAAATALLTVLGLQLLGDRPYGQATALLAGSLFAVHPAHAEAVAWIAGRNDLLPAVFLLTAMTAHYHLRRGSGGWWAFPVWAVGCGLAVLSKESAVPMLLIFPLYDLLIGQDPRPVWRRLLTFSTAILVLIMIGYFGMRDRELGSPLGEAPVQERSVRETAVTVLLTLGFYIKHLIVPYPSNAFIVFPLEIAWPQVGMILAGAAAVVLCVGMTLRARTRLLSLGLWLTLLGLAAPLVVPLVKVTHAPMAERYLYLPSIGAVFLMAAALIGAGDGLQEKGWFRCGRRAGWAMGLILLTVFSAGSILRNSVWKGDRTLWEDTVIKSPHAAVPHNLLGLVYRHQGRFEEARREFQSAVRSVGYPETLALAYNNLGGIYRHEGRMDLAEQAFESSIRLWPSLPLAHYNYGVLYWERFQSASEAGNSRGEGRDLLMQARHHLIRAVVANPSYADAYYVLGLVNLALKWDLKARENFEKVVELDPLSTLGQEAARRLVQDR